MSNTEDKSKQISEAFDKIYGNMVVHVKDSSGNRKMVNASEMKDAFVESVSKGSPAVYYNDDNTFSSSPPAKVTLDKKTGDIKIKAPEYYLKSDYYKNEVKPVLESYSQAYKSNSNYKFPVSSDEGAEEHDVAWYVDKFNEDLPQMMAMEELRQIESSKIGHDLSYDDLRTMNSVAVTYRDSDGAEHKVSDSDRQAIPNIEEANFLKEALGDAWDEETNTVDYKTLMAEGWNREKQSDENIIKLIEAVDHYFERKDFSDTGLYSQMYAFRNFMNQQNPNTGFWRGTADVASNIGYGALTGAASFWAGAFNVMEGLFNIAGGAGTTLAKGMRTGDWSWSDPTTGKMTFFEGVAKDMEDLQKEHEYKAKMLNQAGGATYSVLDTITPFVLQYFTGKGLTKLATDSLAAAVSARTAKLVSEAKAASNSIEKTAYSIYAGTNFIMDALPTEQAVQATVSAFANLNTVSQAINSGAAFANSATVAIGGAKVAAWAVEMTSDAVIDCALGRPDVVRAILDGDNEQDKNMLLNELGMNIVFWGAARGVGGVGKAVKKTDLGRIATTQASKLANKTSAKVGNAADKIKSWVFGDDWKEKLIQKRDIAANLGGQSKKSAKRAQKLTQKIQTLANRESVRGQQEILGKMSIFDDSDGIMDNIRKMENQILNIKKAQILWDDSNLRRATSQMFETLTNSDFDPEFKGAFDSYMAQLKEVISAENAAGFSANKLNKGALDAAGESGIRILDQRTINYFNARIHLGYNREYGEVAMNELQKFVKDFEKVATPELVEATDALVNRYRDVYYNLHRIGLAEDLGLNFYNANEIAELNNATGKDGLVFGENGRLYGKTMRVTDFEDWQSAANRGVAKNKSTVLSHAMNTADGNGDFVDPTYVMCTEITDRSRIAVSQANANILTTLPGVNTEARVGAGATEQARLYKTDGYASAIKGQTASMREDIELSDMFDSAFVKNKTGTIRANVNLANDSKFTTKFDELLDTYIDDVHKTQGGKNLYNRLSAHSGNLQDKEFEYLAFSSLAGNSSDMLEKLRPKAQKYYSDILSGVKGLNKSQISERADKLADNFLDAISNRIEGRAADLAGELLENGSDIVDTNRLYSNIVDAMADIEGAKFAKDTIKVYDIRGRETWVKTDPLLADIFNNRPVPSDMSGWQKVNNLWNRTFRLGTTGANLKSFMAQNVKDFGNAWVAGGADATIKEITSHLTNELGEEIVSQIQQFEPSAYSQLERKAAETGEDLASLAVQREISIGKAISPSTTETEAFSFAAENRAARFGGAGNYYMTGGYEKFDKKISSIMEKLEAPNNARETYLRDLTYANGFSDAIDAGQTIKNARFSARFMMNNATTNFGREMYHLNNLRNSVPYLGAAVNGTKSFWRLWSLDPIGVTGRIMGGIAAPVVYLTGQSLATEENRRIWKNIPEYQKDGNIVFVTNGQIVSIPIPEEIGGFINPIRQFVEHLNGVDPASFQELMLNDLIGLQPFNLDGFVMLDRNRLLADPTIWDRIGAGVSKFSAQIMPPAIKSGVIFITGKDPYTGKAIPTTREYVDPDTGETLIMDYTSGSFAKAVSNLFGGSVSAPMAQTILNNIIGTAGTDILNGLWGDSQKIFSGKFDEMIAAPELAQNIAEQISAPFTIPKYSLANSQWQQAVNQLYAKKTEILNSSGYQDAIRGMSKATTDNEYDNYKKAKQNYLDDYYNLVKTTVDKLNQTYPQAFDSAKFAAVISLMNMDTTTYSQTTGNYGENAYNDYLHDQLKQSGRDVAVSTMAELGFTSSSANSIFGYYGTDKETGKAVIYYNNPISILNMKYADNGADKIHLASIRDIVNKNKLWDEHEAIQSQVNAIYNSKKKLSNSDYNKIDAIYVEWNARVMSALAPYIQEMTPEAAINNSNVIDYIDSLIEIPGDYKVDKKGYHVTNKTLGKGSANDAYIKNYIKEIFQINDTGYISGKNYSGRK